jgi:hypothetical protein
LQRGAILLSGNAPTIKITLYKSTNISYKLNQSQLLSEIGPDRSQPKSGNDNLVFNFANNGDVTSRYPTVD